MWNVKSTSRVKLWMFLLIWRPVIRDVSPSEDLFVYTADTCVYFCSPLGAAAPQRHCKSTQPHISHPIRWQEIIAPLLWLPGFSDFDCWWCFCRFWTTSVKYFLNDGMMMSLQGRGLSGGLREGWCWVVHVVAFLIPCFYTCLWRACPQFRSPPEWSWRGGAMMGTFERSSETVMMFMWLFLSQSCFFSCIPVRGRTVLKIWTRNANKCFRSRHFFVHVVWWCRTLGATVFNVYGHTAFASIYNKNT